MPKAQKQAPQYDHREIQAAGCRFAEHRLESAGVNSINEGPVGRVDPSRSLLQKGISTKNLRPRNQALTLLKSRTARTSPASYKSRFSLKGFKYRLYFDHGEGRFAGSDRRRRRFHFT
jgi:hypothetical protein